MSDASVFETCGIKFPLRKDLPESVSITHSVSKQYIELANQRSDENKCDVTLIVGGQKLYAHETVLSQIPFFRGLFNSNMMESINREVHVSSPLCEFDHFSIESLINYAYTGLVTISIENVQNLIMGAVYLNLEFIIDECARFMRDRIDVDNALSLLVFLKSIAHDKLKQTILGFIDANFVPISKTSEFLELSFVDVFSLLKRKSLNVDDEKQVLDAANRWIRHIIEDRERYSTMLLKCVWRFNKKLTDNRIAVFVKLMSDPNCMVAAEKMKNAYLTKRRRKICDDSCRLIVAIGSESIQFYDPIQNSWTKSPAWVISRNQARGYAKPVVVDKKIFMIDGFNSTYFTGYCFDTVDITWESIPYTPKRYFAATAEINGVIYTVGGQRNGFRLSCMQKFDVAKREWSQGIAAMNHPRSAPAFCVYDGRLYVFGGYNDHQGTLISGEYYDPDTDCWTPTNPMAVKRGGAAAAVLGGKIYVVGGRGASQIRDDVERYDPITDSWETLNPLRSPRLCATLIVSFGRLFLIGGLMGPYGDDQLSTVDIYDSETDCWEEISSMPEHAVNICALPIPATFATPFVNFETTFSPCHSIGFRCLVPNGDLLRAIHDAGFKNPSQIQNQFIPRAAQAADFICQAKAGTGKTTLAVIATLQQLEPGEGKITALVLCKSRKEAAKIGEMFKNLGKYLSAIKVAIFSRDSRIKKNRGVLQNNCPHIVVGTPGRLLALAQSNDLKLNNIKQFVIDDCDEMVNDQEIQRDLRTLVKYLPQKKEVIVLTTENSSELLKFCKVLQIQDAFNNTETN